ncbi:MAG: hypothetical protein GY861_00385, partial [bacterium]|nr:hypothetical protein [bacterium]
MRSSSNNYPPKLAERILSRLYNTRTEATVIGDFEEQYSEILNEKGKRKAVYWYWGQVFNVIKGKTYNKILWSSAMIRNYMKIAMRNILKQKIYSFINISGLAIGLASCVLVML